MATIPIEIILQDAEAPVDPTPTPESETNITVPDTGAEVAGGNNTFASSSAVGIILPIVIAILAIVTAMVLMIRKHHNKHFSSVMNKKKKLTTAVSSTIAILAVTVLVGNLVIPVTNAATDDTNREGKLIVDDKITITVTREAGSNEAIVSSIDTKSYATVYKTFGYEVAISMAEGLTNANLYLDGNEESEYYFSPVEDGTLSDNTWGYTLDQETEEYNAIPLADDLAVVAKGTTEVTDKEVDVYYGIKVASDMPNGTYTGELEYTLADTGFPAALRTMQDMTTDICSSVPTPEPFKSDSTTIEDNVPTIMLPDSRDNKLYRVSKLADGKCWMTQNLDLEKEDLLAGIVLNDSNTDHPAEGFILPISQTEGGESWGNNDDRTAVNTTHVYDIAASGETYRYCLDYQGYCAEWGDVIPEEELGDLYNWYAATAGTGTYDTGSDNDKKATGSICPANWKLPNNSDSDEATDYSNLLYVYGILKNNASSEYYDGKLIEAIHTPLNFIPSGGYQYGSFGNTGLIGYYWSSLAENANIAKNISFNTRDVSPWGTSEKYTGRSVRCLAR